MYIASDKRYDKMKYNRCGDSGLKLPAISLGLWHNFGDTGVYSNMEQMCFCAFDNGVTHFDLANNYGPKPGSAEANFGRILKEHLAPYRDELIISTIPLKISEIHPDWTSLGLVHVPITDPGARRMGLLAPSCALTVGRCSVRSC